MDDNSKNGPVRQATISRTQQKENLQNARDQYTNELDVLTKKKAELGHENVEWNDFLEIVPEGDTTTQSAIMALQDEYKDLLEQEKTLWPENEIIEEFNKKHAVIHIDQTYILTEKINALGLQDFSLESRQSFRAYYEDERIINAYGKEESKADIWLRDPRRRKYENVIFDPKTTKQNGKLYNLWKGFAKNATRGNYGKYWNHVKENISSGDDAAYQYVRKWLAYIFQHPDIVHTAIILYGSQGVGKNSFVDPLGVLLGAHYAPLNNLHQLTSNFNFHLKYAVLIHANEAIWGGDRRNIGTVKAMITEPTCLLEGKGKDQIVVRNFKHVILSSNEDWIVHLDADDRRFFVLHVSDQHKEDHAYFAAIQHELNNGGYEALLYDLLHEDLTGFNPRHMPSSSHAFSMKMRSAESSERYLYEVLRTGGFSISESAEEAPAWQGPIPRADVYKDYRFWCLDNGEKTVTQELLGKSINKLITSVKNVRATIGGKRRWCYEFSSLKQTQEEFCKAFKEKPEKIFNEESPTEPEHVQDTEILVQAAIQGDQSA